MEIFIVVNEWCNSTESGYDVITAYEFVGDAEVCINTMHLDFIHGCDRGEIPDFNDYFVEETTDCITIFSKSDSNFYERYYFIEKELL